MGKAVKLKNGIEEGSVLGPMCFFSKFVDVSITAERTVTKITKEVKELKVYIIASDDNASALLFGDSEEVLQHRVDIISDEFFSSTGLSMNPNKSEVISFQSRRTRTKEITL